MQTNTMYLNRGYALLNMLTYLYKLNDEEPKHERDASRKRKI